MIEPGRPVGLDFELDREELPLRVLVIGSRPSGVALLQQLESLTGLTSEITRYPREALDKLARETYDVIVVDLPLLHMTPEELYRELVAHHPEQLDRTVFLASDLQDPATRKFLTEAGRPYLTYPVEPAELYELIVRIGLPEERE